MGVSPTGTVALPCASPSAIGAAPTAPAVSFRAVFEADFSYVQSTLLRLGVPERDVDDVTHDVFVTVYHRLSEYDPARARRPWLFGIAFRHAANYRRSARCRREVVVDAAPDVDDGAPAPDSQLGAHETRALVLRALAALDLDKRAVLVMHDIDGRTAPEIAEALSVPLNTVYSRLRVARERFQAEVRRIELEEVKV